MISIFVMLLVGLIIGALAQLLTSGPHTHSVLLTIGLGLAGAVVAGFFGRLIGWYQTPWDGPGILASTLGAIFLVWLVHRGRRLA
jgi:uncharacterized membrane protein YeaQ/YmgE (transglycosylase-associated protein family)